MDWTALTLSLKLAAVTLVLLLPLVLVLPPTVLGYHLLVSLGGNSPVGQWARQWLGIELTFNFTGLLIASVVFNVPFMAQPVQRAFEAIPRNLAEAAAVSGLSRAQTFRRVELPLIWPGVLSAMVLTFVHTLGEFGVVLMVGGSIPGETRTLAIAIYDQVQGFNLAAANHMSAVLLVLSLVAVAFSFVVSARLGRRP
ncbi:MAG: molybdate ABC transporter permease subunit [Rhodoferax sp.]|nr:molybdate ABC transporter permease subunit [Rhodoferax sp.]